MRVFHSGLLYSSLTRHGDYLSHSGLESLSSSGACGGCLDALAWPPRAARTLRGGPRAALARGPQLRDELDIIPVVTIPVVRLPHERRARALRLAGAVIAAILMLPLLFRLVQDRLPGLRLPVPN